MTIELLDYKSRAVTAGKEAQGEATIEARHGVTTGISAADRATTILTAAGLLLPMGAHAAPELTPTEERFQRLWREYFATLAIAARENRRLQQSKVPLKVRPWLVEF